MGDESRVHRRQEEVQECVERRQLQDGFLQMSDFETLCERCHLEKMASIFGSCESLRGVLFDSSKWSCSNSNIVLGFCQNLSDTERCYGVQLHLNISEKLRQPSWTIVKHFDSIYSTKHFLHNTTTPDIICDDFVGVKHTRTDHIHPILTLVKHAARIDISRRSMN